MERSNRGNSRDYRSNRGPRPRGGSKYYRGGRGDRGRNEDSHSHGRQESEVIVLDVLPHGRPGKGPAYRRVPLIIGLGVQYFSLLEVEVEKDADVKIQDSVKLVDGPRFVKRVKRRIGFGELTGTARDMLEPAVETVVKNNEERFTQFWNNARPITTRKHQLQLFPGIGKKHLWEILDNREKKPFESYKDFEDRVGLNPLNLLVRLILQEIELDDIKYRLFTRDPPPPQPPARKRSRGRHW
ncbi:MAG: DUF655 domain-containing protein [Promethearchaeota archaeon]